MVRSVDARGPPAILVAPAILCVVFVFCAIVSWTLRAAPVSPTDFCPQVAAMLPPTDFLALSQVFFDPEYQRRSAGYLGGAIQIPTQSFDDMGSPQADPRFKVFSKLNNYLEHTFPLAAKHGDLKYINKHGMLYTFKGSTPDLKPVLLMAHQDVVPVSPETEKQWDYPPFSGHYDGEYVYGRGSSDCKNTLVGILESVESLLQQGWVPTRTLLLSFGYDEELTGDRGAGHLAAEIEKTWGKHGVEVIVDEGGGLLQMGGALVAVPMVAEKGYVDIAVTVNTPGGHSSIPPDHTGIGIVSELIKTLEANPFRPSLANENPNLAMFRCIAEHAPDLPESLKDLILDVDRGDNRAQLIDFISERREMAYLIRTSQAVDIISGGVKINALPEQVKVVVNYRVGVHSSVADTVAAVESHIVKVAKQFDLSVVSHARQLSRGAAGQFNITTSGIIDVAPISPSQGDAWNLVAGTTRHIFENVSPETNGTGLPIVVAPGVMEGNTDTAKYWNVSSTIYRYTPLLETSASGIHTVNEKIKLVAHLTGVAWYYEFIINATR